MCETDFFGQNWGSFLPSSLCSCGVLPIHLCRFDLGEFAFSRFPDDALYGCCLACGCFFGSRPGKRESAFKFNDKPSFSRKIARIKNGRPNWAGRFIFQQMLLQQTFIILGAGTADKFRPCAGAGKVGFPDAFDRHANGHSHRRQIHAD